MVESIPRYRHPKVRMHVVRFVTERMHHGRRGNPAIPTGTTLYAIAYEKGGYFTYSYMKREDALQAIDNMEFYGTDTEFYYPFNVKSDIQDTLHVAPK